jgi:hypothetical protein
VVAEPPAAGEELPLEAESNHPHRPVLLGEARQNQAVRRNRAAERQIQGDHRGLEGRQGSSVSGAWDGVRHQVRPGAAADIRLHHQVHRLLDRLTAGHDRR